MPTWLEQITEELDAREKRQREFHGKSDDHHGDFARWLLEQFDKQQQSDWFSKSLQERLELLAKLK
jgi:hypothetical protein